jgi:dTDP-4-amino-4,6-dideoxygalactose transaminase
MMMVDYTKMRKLEKRLLLSSPTMHGEEQEYIKAAFDQNWIAPLGFNCDGFENEMNEYLGGDYYPFATVSGTSAIHLSLKLAGVKPGDIVFCSDLTFAATCNPVSYEDGVQVFIDSEEDTWNMSPEALEKAFEKYPQCRIVLLAHLYGTPSRMNEIMDICRKHNAVIIEDAAEALGSEYQGRKCGTFGQYGVLSFNGNKIITTSGGGMLITKEPEKRQKALFWATQTREQAPWYQHKELGYNYRMSNVVAGIGRGQLKHLEEHRKLKENIYKRYREGLQGFPVRMNPYLSDSTPNFWLSCLTVNPDAMCRQIRTDNTTSWIHENGKTCPDEMAAKLLEYNIETRPVWKPMHMQPCFQDRDFISTGVGEDIFARGICLPSDIKMTSQEQDTVIEIIKSCF